MYIVNLHTNCSVQQIYFLRSFQSTFCLPDTYKACHTLPLTPPSMQTLNQTMAQQSKCIQTTNIYTLCARICSLSIRIKWTSANYANSSSRPGNFFMYLGFFSFSFSLCTLYFNAYILISVQNFTFKQVWIS